MAQADGRARGPCAPSKRPFSKACAATEAGFTPDASYAEAVRLVSQVVVSNAGYEPPEALRCSAVQQAVDDKSPHYTLGWHGGDKEAFLRSAMHLPHPAHHDSLDLPAVLMDVIELIVRKREGIVHMRTQRLSILKSAAALVAPMRTAMLASVRPHILHTISSYDPALIAVVIDAIKHPDLLFVRDLLQGFPCYGHLPTAGVFKLGGAPPKQPIQPTLNPASNYFLECRASLFCTEQR